MRVPYGYKKVSFHNGEYKWWEIIPEKAEILRKMFFLYINQDFNFQRIADFLTKQNIKTPRGFEKWTASFGFISCL